MSLFDIFNALCDAFTLTEMQKAEASRKIQNTLLFVGDEFIPPYFCEDDNTSKSQIKSDEKRE